MGGPASTSGIRGSLAGMVAAIAAGLALIALGIRVFSPGSATPAVVVGMALALCVLVPFAVVGSTAARLISYAICGRSSRPGGLPLAEEPASDAWIGTCSRSRAAIGVALLITLIAAAIPLGGQTGPGVYFSGAMLGMAGGLMYRL